MLDVDSNENDGMITLPESLDLVSAEPLHRTLLDRLRAGDPLILGGAAVERVSTAVIQVLLAAAAEGSARGIPFQLRDPSPVLSEALADLGVASHFGF